jgi:hypothetical protein
LRQCWFLPALFRWGKEVPRPKKTESRRYRLFWAIPGKTGWFRSGFLWISSLLSPMLRWGHSHFHFACLPMFVRCAHQTCLPLAQAGVQLETALTCLPSAQAGEHKAQSGTGRRTRIKQVAYPWGLFVNTVRP